MLALLMGPLSLLVLSGPILLLLGLSGTILYLVERKPDHRFFYGWVIVILCTIAKVAKCFGQNNFLTFFNQGVMKDLEMSVTSYSGLFSVATFTGAGMQVR